METVVEESKYAHPLQKNDSMRGWEKLIKTFHSTEEIVLPLLPR